MSISDAATPVDLALFLRQEPTHHGRGELSATWQIDNRTRIFRMQSDLFFSERSMGQR